jgi:predicted extracellular nuclease
MKALHRYPLISCLLTAGTLVLPAAEAAAQSVFINELHYDNTGTDSGEAIEIAGPAGMNLSGCSVVLYNGSSGVAYNSTALSSVIPDQQNGFGTVTVNYGTNGIQNGAPDGVALVGASAVIQFLSYEGAFTAIGGPADGLESTDIGVVEGSGTAEGDSLQLTGTGSEAADFTWVPPTPATFGAVNTGQTFSGEPGSDDPCGGGDPGDPGDIAGVVINEIHADPAADLTGDANRDGVRDSSADEFVEIVNTTGGDLDISGWTLSDGVGVRHTFPAGSIVGDDCALVVFGGGSPTGVFGNTLVQPASIGLLELNNSGDTVTLSNGSGSVAVDYGSEGGSDESLTLDPDVTGSPPLVRHTTAAGAGGSLFSPGTRVTGAQFAGCEALPVGPFEVFEIQGSGAASPFTGRLVQTVDNVVTALAPDGFFIQTPASRSDGDVNTSDGIFVFTDGAPTVAVGDLVDVTAQVQEFFDFTELAGEPLVTVDSSGHPLPAPVAFSAAVPSPDPVAPSCALEYECYEGMLVEIENGTVTGSNQHFGSDPVAEVHITAAPERVFREPGVEFPGIPSRPEIPVWDGNPEVFELDPDKLGLPNLIIPGGSHFDAIGVVGFEFGGYELWPTSLSVSELPIPRPVRAREAGEFTIGSLNLFRLFDDVNDEPDTNTLGEPRDDQVVSTEEYESRRAKFVDYVLNVLDAPDVLAVQEAEKLGVLEDLAADIAAANPDVAYNAYLEEGNDIGTIDVGFLVRDTVSVDTITQLGRDEIFDFDGSALHDRPPLLLEGRFQAGADFPIEIMVVHNRSLGGIEDPGSNGERVRLKRLTQAQSIAGRVQEMQTDNPDLRLVIVGDFNAFEFTDGFVDAVGQIAGNVDPDENLLSGPDLVMPDLVNQVLSSGAGERYSFIFNGSAQVLDHALTSMALDGSVRGFDYGRGNADAAENLLDDAATPLRSSDHDGLVLFLTTDRDADGVGDDADFCPGTVIPEAVPTSALGINRWALTDADFEFDTGSPPGGGPGLHFTTEDTAGCSCAQVIAAQGLGAGHRTFGCSTGEMQAWLELVTGSDLRN